MQEKTFYCKFLSDSAGLFSFFLKRRLEFLYSSANRVPIKNRWGKLIPFTSIYGNRQADQGTHQWSCWESSRLIETCRREIEPLSSWYEQKTDHPQVSNSKTFQMKCRAHRIQAARVKQFQEHV